jgi:transcriptional regulator with XRE-family HTH domain
MHLMQIEDANSAVGARVAELRKGRFSQTELAQELSEKLGKSVDPTTITRLEGGKRPITANEIVALAEIFGIGPYELLPEWRAIEASQRYWQRREQALHLEFVTLEEQYNEARIQLETSSHIVGHLAMLAEYKRTGRWADDYTVALTRLAQDLQVAGQGASHTFLEILRDLGISDDAVAAARLSGEYSPTDEERIIKFALREMEKGSADDRPS